MANKPINPLISGWEKVKNATAMPAANIIKVWMESVTTTDSIPPQMV